MCVCVFVFMWFASRSVKQTIMFPGKMMDHLTISSAWQDFLPTSPNNYLCPSFSILFVQKYMYEYITTRHFTHERTAIVQTRPKAIKKLSYELIFSVPCFDRAHLCVSATMRYTSSSCPHLHTTLFTAHFALFDCFELKCKFMRQWGLFFFLFI